MAAEEKGAEGATTAPIDPLVADEEPDLDRILTPPNIISVVRLLCIPIFLVLLFGEEERAWAAGLLAVLGATDWVDGFLARRYGWVTTLGKILDPTADRLLLAVGVIAILVDGSVPVVIAVLTIVRETFVAVAALALAAAGARRIDVTWAGKAGTFGQMVAYPLFLAGASEVSWAGAAEALAWVCIVPGLLFAYVSAVRYVPLARGALRDGRVGSGG